MIYEGRLVHEAFDAGVRPQQLYRRADLREVVVPLSVLPVGSGVVDEPFRRHVKTVETNAAVCLKVGWTAEFHFFRWRRGHLIQRINDYRGADDAKVSP